MFKYIYIYIRFVSLSLSFSYIYICLGYEPLVTNWDAHRSNDTSNHGLCRHVLTGLDLVGLYDLCFLIRNNHLLNSIVILGQRKSPLILK